MESEKPQLPPKLPIEARKKRSIINLDEAAPATGDNVETLVASSIDDAEENDYFSPMAPNASNLPTILNNNNSHLGPSPGKKHDVLEFFNDSIYFDSTARVDSKNASDDDYSALACYSSDNKPAPPADPRPPAARKLINHAKSRLFKDETQMFGSKLAATTSNAVDELMNEYHSDEPPTSGCPPALPPKRKPLAEQFGKLSLMISSTSEKQQQQQQKSTNKIDAINDDEDMYIPPSDKKVLSFGKTKFNSKFYIMISHYKAFYVFRRVQSGHIQ